MEWAAWLLMSSAVSDGQGNIFTEDALLGWVDEKGEGRIDKEWRWRWHINVGTAFSEQSDVS